MTCAVAMLRCVHKIAMIERKRFSHHCCARTQAATLTWLAYYDFTCVYVVNMQTTLKSLLAFVHSVVKTLSLNHCNTFVYTNIQHGRIRKDNENLRSCKSRAQYELASYPAFTDTRLSIWVCLVGIFMICCVLGCVVHQPWKHLYSSLDWSCMQFKLAIRTLTVSHGTSSTRSTRWDWCV